MSIRYRIEIYRDYDGKVKLVRVPVQHSAGYY